MLAAIPSLVRFTGTSAEWLDYPYPRAGSEGLILYESLLLKRGGDIYAPITPERFISGPYPPIFYWLAAAILPENLPDFTSPETATSVFVPGRAVSLISTVAATLMIVSAVAVSGFAAQGRRKLLCGLTGGIVGGLVFLAMPQVEVWATRFRGDMLMIALTAGGLVCIAAGAMGRDKSVRWPWLLAGAALFSLAFHTKQTALAGPIAAALFMLARDWRTGLKWCVAMFAVVLIPLVGLEIATGHWFYLKMVDYHSLPLRRLTLERLLQFAFWEDEWPVILLAGGYAVGSLVQQWMVSNQPSTVHRPRGSRSDFRVPQFGLVPLFVLAALITLPTGAVVGADHNHLLMSGLAVSMGIGALVASFLDRLSKLGQLEAKEREGEPGSSRRRVAISVGGIGIAFLLGNFFLVTSEPSSWYNPDLVKPSAEQQEQLRKIVLNVRQNPGTTFFADDPGIVALAGKETPYDDPFTMSALAQQGRWDEAAYREQLRTGKFGLLILSCDVTVPNSCRGDTFTPGVLDAIREGYDLLFRDVLYTYTPKAR